MDIMQPVIHLAQGGEATCRNYQRRGCTRLLRGVYAGVPARHNFPIAAPHSQITHPQIMTFLGSCVT